MKQIFRRPQWWAVLIALVALGFSIFTYMESRPYHELGAVYSKLEILEKRLEACQSWVAQCEKENLVGTSVDEMKTNLLEAEAKLNAARGKAISGQLDLATTDIEDANELLDKIPIAHGPIQISIWVLVAIVLGCILVISVVVIILRGHRT